MFEESDLRIESYDPNPPGGWNYSSRSALEVPERHGQGRSRAPAPSPLRDHDGRRDHGPGSW